MQFAAIKDVDWDTWPICHVGWNFRNLSDRLHALDNLTENYMLAIEMLTLLKCDEEL